MQNLNIANERFSEEIFWKDSGDLVCQKNCFAHHYTTWYHKPALCVAIPKANLMLDGFQVKNRM